MGVANKETIYWTALSHEYWEMIIAATVKGLCYVGSPEKGFDELAAWIKNKRPSYCLEQNEEKLQPFMKELKEYFHGTRQTFSFAVDLQGTPFQCSVWNALCHIPYGSTCSYTEIAEQLQKPKAVRAVGTAIGANPILITIPCHRVIGKNGHLTGYRGGLEMKQRLLKIEAENIKSSCGV